MPTRPYRLILASSSPYRAELLRRLQLPFEIAAPAVDESPLSDETARELALRLAEKKARAVESRFPNSLIIGSDQVAALEGQLLGKPGHHAAAVAQLHHNSGKWVDFYTSLCLLNSTSGRVQRDLDLYSVRFRDLTSDQIESYLQREQPYQCAGSFKAEGLGVALLQRHHGDDPTALIGLPLISLVRMLEREGVDIL
ncbi:MAG: maf protein [Halothiobacillaceae bacterium]|nr:MAG: maf protein [Halothiobacillaceae bacterium]